MAIELLMPALSPTMEEGTLAKWLVKEGDTVASGDLLAEIETDKATMEFEAVDEGVIGKLLVAEGTEGVKVNSPIALILEEGEEAGDVDAPAKKEPAPPTKDAEAEPAKDEKVDTAPIEDAQKGYGREEGGDAPRAGAKEESATQDGERVFITPVARRIAAQKNLDISTLKGSGPRGRIVKADVEAAEERAPDAAEASPKEAKASEAAPAKAPVVAAGASADAVMKMYAARPYKEIKLDGMRRTIAARLTEAKQTIPHFYLRRNISLDALLAFRKDLNAQLEGRDIRLSINDFIIKACALALQKVPEANAVWAADRVLQMEASDVAVAVAVDGGLFTPVLRDAQQKTISALSAEMKSLAGKARDRKLKPEDYQGGSFAISNLGMFGIDSFDAVINPPHGSILAIGAGVPMPTVGKDGEIGIETMMSASLSVDHRVIDGALGARFLQSIAEHIETPLTMLV